MTNSAPKLKNKVERQGSPNIGVERHHNHRSSSVKSTTFFHNGGRNGKNNTTPSISTSSSNSSNSSRLSCSPNSSSSKSMRNLPPRYESLSPRGSPTNSFYAGAKFSEPPSPASLPKPPSHWTTRLMNGCHQSDRSCDISNHLKMILNVQA